MNALWSLYLVFFATFFLTRCNCTGENYEKKLVRKLMDDYDTSVRPSKNASESLNVTFGLALTQIIDVDERNQILTTNCWLNEMWIDYSLKWNPADYGGIKVIRIPSEKVWRPDIILYNNADSQYNLAILSTNVIISSDGNITWLSTGIFKSSCSINVEYFPFDEQNCTMKFASWTYDGFQVNLVIGTEEGDLSNYVINGEWDLISMQSFRHVVYYSCCTEPYPDITYTIVLRRRPLFYVFNLILPCVLISGLALLSFYMPSDSGEKVTLGITTLLSMTVFLMVIGESMPPTSEKLPLIGLYYGVTISLVSFATGLSVVTLNIHHRGMRGQELPLFFRTFIFKYLAKALFLRLEFPKRAMLDISLDEGNGGSGSAVAVTPATENTALTCQPKRIGDSWRIVYPDPDAPSAPPPTISCYCDDLDPSSGRRDNWQRCSGHNHIYDARYSSYGNLQTSTSGGSTCSNCCGGFYSGFKPVMRVRGIPSGDGPPQQNASDDSVLDSTIHKCPHFHDVVNSGAVGHSSGSAPPTTSNSRSGPIWELRLTRLLTQVHATMEKNEVRLEEKDRKEIIKLEWQQAALVIDRLLLWIFVVATVGATFGILYMSPHTKLFST